MADLSDTVDLPRSVSNPLILENKHTGERLELRRIRLNGEECLEIRGYLPPQSQGPPLHIHLLEKESGTVHAGQLTAVVDGRRIEVGPGESFELPVGCVHRWWNEGDETLEFSGCVQPVVDLDRYLQAGFDVMNAGSPGRPSLTYMAHVMRRHRETQQLRMMPRLLQTLLLRIAYFVGVLTGAYRGEDWPGCPAKCTGAPPIGAEVHV